MIPSVYLTFPEACEYARINRNKTSPLTNCATPSPRALRWPAWGRT